MTKYLRTRDGHAFAVSPVVTIVDYRDTAVTDTDAATIQAQAAASGVELVVSDTPTSPVPVETPDAFTITDQSVAGLVTDDASATWGAIAGRADDMVAAQVTTPGTDTAAALTSRFLPRWRPNTAYTTGAAVLNPFGDVVTAKTGFTSGASYSAANWNVSQAYVPRASLILPAVSYFAHRGGAGYAPEETMEAFRVSAASGVTGLEMDVQPLSDGTLGLMHDDTVDRTTDGTGDTSTFTAPAWRALNATKGMPWNGKSVPPALLTEALAEFGGVTNLMIEPKDAANAAQVMDLVDAQALVGSVILATTSQPVLTAIKTRNPAYRVYYYWNGSITSPTPAAIVSAGADFLGCNQTQPDSDITALVATGKPVIMFTVNRRLERDRLLALGVKGFLGDQPVYLRANTAQRKVDSWRQGVLGHGFQPSLVSVTPSITGGRLRVTSTPQTKHSLVGEVSPVANPNNVVVTVNAGFDVLPTAVGGAVAVGLFVDDGPYENTASSMRNGYLCYLRKDGGLRLYKVTGPGTATQLGTTVATPALVAGVLPPLRLTQNATIVRAERTDGAYAVEAADTTYRGGYVFIGKTTADTDPVFSGLTVTP